MAHTLTLYHHIRSSASYRVRIALALKGLDYRSHLIDLSRHDQLAPGFAEKNPARLVPVLDDDGTLITQSLAIIEYLDETYPQAPLLPRTSAADRAWVRQIALSIGCEIHPLQNLGVLNHLRDDLGLNEAQRHDWSRHWIARGFDALEQRLSASPRRGAFCFGDQPSLADVFLVPQVVNARRFEVDMKPYPILREIDDRCMALPAFADTHPSRFPARS